MYVIVTGTDKLHNRIPPAVSHTQTFLMTISPVLSSAQDHQSSAVLSIKMADNSLQKDECTSATRTSKLIYRLKGSNKTTNANDILEKGLDKSHCKEMEGAVNFSR